MAVCPVCDKPADKLCSGCHGVSYCSPEHQKKDWKTHKKTCRLFVVKQNDVLGRYTIAARDIPAGNVIMSEDPLMIGPKQNTKPLCLGCYKAVTGDYYCSKCNFPLCGPECEKIPLHAEYECPVFRKPATKIKITDFENPHPVYECILTLRCLLLRDKDPKKWAALTQMEHHNAVRQNLKELWHRNQINTVQFLRDRYQMTDFSEELIHTVLGYTDVNAFEIRGTGIEICGLYNNIYIMSHECISNTHHTVTEDHKMVLRAATPIRKGQAITTVYTHTLDATLERRHHLRESKFFDCSCARCADPTEMGTYLSAIKCAKRLNEEQCSGYSVPFDPLNYWGDWKCEKCGHTIPQKEVNELVDGIKNKLDSLKEGQTLIPELETILATYSGTVLHPNHFLIIGIIHSLSELYGRTHGWLISDLNMQMLLRKEKHCRHLLQVLDVIEPGMSRIRGLTMYELHAALYFIAQRKFQNGALTTEQLKVQLTEVLRLLREAQEILNFDGPHTPEGAIGKSIPDSILGVEAVMQNCCP